MVKKVAFLAAVVALVWAGSSFGAALNPPPAHGGYQAGWGMNPTNWQTATGSFSAWAIYDPLHVPLGGAAWVVGYDGSFNPLYINYAPITLELWIEMYCLQTYEYTSYQWHRLGDNAETISFIIQGIMQSNNGQWVSLMKGTEDLTYLFFREDILGRTGAPYGYDIPITWEGRYGAGLSYGGSVEWGWETLTPDTEGDLNIGPIDACDHWFQFRGTFQLPYHIADGYYSLEMEGCPAPVL